MIFYCTPSSTKTPVRIADTVRRLRFFMQDADDDASLRQRCSMCGRSLLSPVRTDAWPRQPPVLLDSCSVENEVRDNVLKAEAEIKARYANVLCCISNKQCVYIYTRPMWVVTSV